MLQKVTRDAVTPSSNHPTLLAVTVDDREPAWVKGLTWKGAPRQIARLDTGDFWLSCSDGELLVVERKTASDLVSSLAHDRLFNQVGRMRELTEWCYLIISGGIAPGPGGMTAGPGIRIDNGWNWCSVTGALSEVQELGVVVLNVYEDADIEPELLRRVARKRGPKRIRPPRPIEFVSESEAIIASLPGIGEERARVLLEHFASPADVLDYLTGDNKRVIPGIGPGIRARVRKALGLEEWGCLSVLHREIEDTPQTA
jgi:ERCC4-type nuclease